MFYRYPGYDGHGYKSVRFTSSGRFPWPRNPDSCKFLACSTFVRLGDEKNRVSTVIRGFEGAPGFTRTELEAVCTAINSECFDGQGCISMNKTHFSEDSLAISYAGGMGTHIAKRCVGHMIPQWRIMT